MILPSALTGTPPADTPVPVLLQRSLEALGLGAARLSPIWRNGARGLTFSVASGGVAAPIDFYAKWNPDAVGESLTQEAERLAWIQGRHPAPTVVDLILEGPEEVLLTRALPGESAVAPRWKADPDLALRALGTGLRRLHDLDPQDCPFDWGVEHRLRTAGLAAEPPGDAPSLDRLVLCQGDPCAPNTLLAADGSFLAHVDLGRHGVADRWADLAVMSMSLAWNFSGYDEATFWSAYGIEPEAHRIEYYRRLWDAT
ncbi:aminoglycoside 3'-phosphotransferase [Nesterenkonia sp. E16_7]|uniref:aminoglycoside 3'-phosphotransferase n=1 Tax=unclassified Nesterenkonia TaxID=2629769 RepID=UPI001A913221|nr:MULTISPECIES: aminoglycoside 3'-phosphotransferase [unclassified Nesterenkonia]MBO0594440.1 aminoglycoside 3'-phosphotransferase [Nesterenkonia sp. E16_10]MBO0598850.1 aminoglycoside 3'-phosphotransferase [Nesterenkonia sp. E16_7]